MFNFHLLLQCFDYEKMNSQRVIGSPLVSISLPRHFSPTKNTSTGQINKKIRIQISIEILLCLDNKTL